MLDCILYHAEQAYKDVVWVCPEDFDTFAAFERAVKRLDMKSSPGIPYCFEKTTNGSWLGWNGVECDAIQKQRLWYDVQNVLRGSYDNVLRAFIKQEPHKRAKIDSKRWRLIMAAPLAVQVAWHMCFDFMNDLEIEKAYTIPSQQGLVLVSGGWKLFSDSWKARGLTCGLDKSAWDWTACDWMLKLDLQFRYRMGRGAAMSRWLTYAEILYRQMFEECLIQFSNGDTYRQCVPGIMKSGCVNTISTNSHCQVFLHMAASILAGVDMYPLPVACGDDTLQHPTHCEDLDPYKVFGIAVKSVSDTMEFMGHEFREDGVYPLYMMKHLYKIPYVSPEDFPDYLDSMARMYVHTRYFDFWQELALLNGTPLPLSQQAYRFWYDHEV